MPTYCPMMDRHFVEVQKQIAAKPGLRDNVHLLSVSFDPKNDTPPVLKKHAQALGADPALWTFLTGDRDEIDRFAMNFGVTLIRGEATDPDEITHNLRTAIVDRDGKLVKVYTGNEWTPSGSDRGPRKASLTELRRSGVRGQERGEGHGQAFTPAERRLIARLRTPLEVQRYLNALPYNTEPPPGRATLRSFRGVVRHDTRALSRSGALRRRRPRTARLSAARAELRVDRRARSCDLRLSRSTRRPLGIGGAIARPGAARAEGRCSPTPRALAQQLRRSVRRSHRTGHRLRRRRSARHGTTTTGAWRTRTCGRSSGCCSTPASRRCASSDARFRSFRARYRAFKAKHPDRKPLFYEGRERWTPIPKGFA